MENANHTTVNREPLHNIIKSNLVQHSNQNLCSHIIDQLSSQIAETIESFLNKNLKQYVLYKITD